VGDDRLGVIVRFKVGERYGGGSSDGHLAGSREW
jgi:hypothetical protein